jgi:RNA polymerase sigma factor (sigma-70 family)
VLPTGKFKGCGPLQLSCILTGKQSAKENIKLVRLESIEFIPTEVPQDKSQQEKYKALASCISALEENSKSIIILYLEELHYKDIAEITGLTENHIAVKMKRIKKILLNCITNKL